MFISLRLEGFQGHVDSTFQFHPNFNCIVGIGNHGKSSVVRALDFLMYGEWDKSWVNYNSKACRITATLTSGVVLVREKGTGINKYTIQYPDGSYKEYSNFEKSGLPEEILQALRISPIQINPTQELKLNVVTSKDRSLLKEVSRPNRAKLLGKLSGLEVLDNVSQDLALDRKRLQASIRLKTDEQTKVQDQVQSIRPFLDQRTQLEAIQEELNLIYAQVERLNALKQLATKCAEWRGKYSSLKKQVQQFPEIAPQILTPLEKQIERLRQLQTLQQQVTTFKQRRASLETQVAQNAEQLQSARDQYVAFLHQAQKCPTCYSSITSECIAEVLSKL